jgi:SHS2 domain-containing protein
MGRFELFEHTADIGVRGYGSTLAEAFGSTARGLYEVVTNVDSIESIGEVEIKVEGTDMEDLLTRFLTELLFLLDMRKMLMCEFDIKIDEDNYVLVAIAKGEIFDPKKHEYKTEVKAITQHMLEITDDGTNPEEKYRIQVLLDI